MGTNYYWHTNVCPTCKHPENKYHIGKSSAGWTFSFHALGVDESPIGRPVTSAEDWRAVMKTEGRIVDEYGEEKSFDDFWELVARKATAASNHTAYVQAEYPYAHKCWLDAEGHSFSEGVFS